MNKFKVGDRVLTKEGQPFQEVHGPGTVTMVPSNKHKYYYGVALDDHTRSSMTPDDDWFFAETELELLPRTGGGVGPGAPGGDVRSLLAARYETKGEE